MNSRYFILRAQSGANRKERNEIRLLLGFDDFAFFGGDVVEVVDEVVDFGVGVGDLAFEALEFGGRELF